MSVICAGCGRDVQGVPDGTVVLDCGARPHVTPAPVRFSGDADQAGTAKREAAAALEARRARRERLSGLAMQGLIVDAEVSSASQSQTAKRAVEFADALCVELDRTAPPEVMRHPDGSASVFREVNPYTGPLGEVKEHATVEAGIAHVLHTLAEKAVAQAVRLIEQDLTDSQPNELRAAWKAAGENERQKTRLAWAAIVRDAVRASL